MLTKPYQLDPAHYFLKNTFFYSSYKKGSNVVKQQCKKINLDISEVDIKSSNLKKVFCEAVFQTDDIDSDFEKELLRAFAKIEKPY